MTPRQHWPTGVCNGLVNPSDSNQPVHQSARINTVGLVGLEPTTSCSQSRRATKLRHNPCAETVPVRTAIDQPNPSQVADTVRR